MTPSQHWVKKLDLPHPDHIAWPCSNMMLVEMWVTHFQDWDFKDMVEDIYSYFEKARLN